MTVQTCIENVKAALAPRVASGELPGFVAGVSIGGDRRLCAHGVLALGAPAPMTSDTIFRIASLSKLVGAVLTLVLEQEGVLALDDEAAGWLPEFTSPRVIKDMAGPPEDTEPARRPILVRDLLTMTPGFGLVLARGPLQDALRSEGLMPGPFPPPFSHDEFVARLAALPLALQPGEGWLYHTSSDVLAVLLARAAGRSLTDLLGELITGPLGMPDTGFHAREPERLATAYNPSGEGLEVLDLPAGRFSRPPRFEAFGSGLVSTVPDYLAFLEMLAAGGSGSSTILRPDALAAMSTDQLSEQQRASAQLFMGEGWSWGLGCQVALSPSALALAPGSFGWMGGTGTIAYVDPHRSLAAVLFTQRAMETSRPTPAYIDFWDAVYRGL
jgi:CubicO group peptidase (beta-lactamase class C family)